MVITNGLVLKTLSEKIRHVGNELIGPGKNSNLVQIIQHLFRYYKNEKVPGMDDLIFDIYRTDTAPEIGSAVQTFLDADRKDTNK